MAVEEQKKKLIGEPVNFIRRLWGHWIDGFVMAPLLAAITYFYPPSKGYFMMVLLEIFLYMMYYVITHGSRWHATVGKRILKAKVVGLDGEGISYLRATARFIMLMLPVSPVFVVSLIAIYLGAPGLRQYINNMHDIMILQWVLYASVLFSLLLTVIWYIPVLFTEERKGVHDMVCRTRVIKRKT